MRIPAFAALVVLALALAGCSSSGGGGDGGNAEGTETSARGEASGEPVPEGETLTVGWVQVGEGGPTAADAVEEAFPGRLNSVFARDPGDPAAAATELVDAGAQLVLSFVPGTCAAIPEVDCVEPGGSGESGENAVYLDDSWWNRAYLLGRAAGLVTETDAIGYVPAPESPEQTGAVNAFALGCQSANPNCIIRLPAAAAPAKAVRQLRNQDVDVIATPLASPPCGAAGNAAVQPVGSLGDPCGSAILAADAAAILEPLVGAKLEGSFAGGQHQALPLGEWAEGVAADVRSKVEERAAEIDGGLNVFTGPLFDNEGQQQVAEGEELTPEFIAAEWSWLLGGVLEQAG